ncbi:hypothetical protein ABT340_11170 [Streptosporangium sp. NPDC000239]|uniref:hypothetical protein n=1 Tax=Streptosporangium sp. NPDC000239 TaxID=3154248 RepID=UPI003321BA4F
MRRLLLPLAALALLLTGCGVNDPARADFWAKAGTLTETLKGTRFKESEDLGFLITRREGVEVLSVAERTRRDPFRAVVRVTGKGMIKVWEGRRETLRAVPDVVGCFEAVASGNAFPDFFADVSLKEVTCPATTPLGFRAHARFPPRMYERLQETLPGRPDLAKVRKAVQRLDLDPRVVREIAEGGTEKGRTVGIALREGPDGGCMYARVWRGGSKVWAPYRIVPYGDAGAQTCTATGAINGYAERAAH